MKTDTSIRNICVAAIKRRSSSPNGFLSTSFFEKETISEIYENSNELPYIAPNELPIAKTTMDEKNWTLVTTRQVVTCANGIIRSIKAYNILIFDFADFKGLHKTLFTVGSLLTHDQQKLDVFIETGKASMVIIYAIQSLRGQEKRPA